MVTLRIEHKIASLEGWRKAFDSDPLDRKKAGVKHFRIYQPLEEQDLVIIELDFDHHEEAKAMQSKLDQLFPKIEGTIIFGVRMSLFALIESTDL
jgi:hypothetical protein